MVSNFIDSFKARITGLKDVELVSLVQLNARSYILFVAGKNKEEPIKEWLAEQKSRGLISFYYTKDCTDRKDMSYSTFFTP